MINQILKSLGLLIVFALTITLTSCDKDDAITSDNVENYVDDAMFHFQKRGNIGRFGCHELVFPVTIAFSDGSTETVEDYESMRETLRAYKEANPDSDTRPELQFPIEVTTQDGSVVSVDSAAELHELRLECRREFFEKHGPRGHRLRGKFYCFKLDFPLQVEFPDENVEDVEGPRALKHLLRMWKKDNPDAEERPMLVFPLTVTLRDDTKVEVASKEELEALKDSCTDGE